MINTVHNFEKEKKLESECALVVEALSFSWSGTQGSDVFSDVSFKIARGEHVVLIGPNGAGKSTLLHCMAGLLKYKSGNVHINGRDASTMTRRALAREIAFLPQNWGSMPAMRVRDVVATGRYPYFTMFAPATREDKLAVEEAMAITDTVRFADRRINELSGGERQRVMLAAAIAQNAPILLLDEPFTYLDPAGQAEFSAVISKLQQERGVTVLTVTHDLQRAASDGSRVIGLANGRLEVDAAAEEGFSRESLRRLFGCEFSASLLPTSHRTFVVEEPIQVEADIYGQPEVAESPPCLRFIGWAILSVLLFGLVTFTTALIGSPFISPVELLRNVDGVDFQLFSALRLPRSMTAFLVGSSLSVAGMIFQAMFRNPLATPYTLGVSGGASFGAAVAMLASVSLPYVGAVSVQGGAFLGALLSMLIVYGTFHAKSRTSISTVLLAGVGCSFLFSSLIMLLQYICDPRETINTLYWMMGGVFVTGYSEIISLLPALVIGMAAAISLTRELDIMLLGDEVSSGRGVDVAKVRKLLFVAVSFMTAAVVSLCGPIGFVGMMIPHICRLIVGPLHKRLLPVSLLAGGFFLLACDVLARTVIAPAEIPIGVITSFFGAPFLLLLLRNSARK